jgi:5-oxoprolinase (ATP-hydrolysing) subunit A
VIDLNADVGEAVSPEQHTTEAALYPIVTSVNIACGGHAGDPASIRNALTLAQSNNCAIGAHPSFPDRAGFGRTVLKMPIDQLRDSLHQQVSTLASIVDAMGLRLAHIKPHGALYHAASTDESIARVIFDVAYAIDPTIRIIGAANSHALAWWQQWGASVAAEGFVDRVYEPDGHLRSRTLQGAVITSPELAARQAVSIATKGQAIASDGSVVAVPAETICIHADSLGATRIAQQVHHDLLAAGVELRAIGSRG